MNVVRFDKIELPPKVDITPEGYLRGDAILTRTGVFEYANPDGSIRREYRPPEEVFKPESLASFGMRPMTVNHPPPRTDGLRLLDSSTAPKHSVGATGENVRQDGDFMRAPIAIFDAKAVDLVKRGKRGLSNGYTAKLDFTPGTTPQGEHYDCIQRDIRGDHIAIVDAPRAGATAQIRLDSIGNQELEDEEGERDMVKVNLDGISYDAAPEVANALSKAQAETREMKAQLDSAGAFAKAEADALRGERDTFKERVDELEKRDVTAEIAKGVKARVALNDIARRALDAKEAEKLDSMTDDQIRRAVILAKYPEAKLDDKSEPYIQARFDAVVESLGDEDRRSTAIHRQRATVTERADGVVLDEVDEAVRKAEERIKNQWKPKAA